MMDYIKGDLDRQMLEGSKEDVYWVFIHKAVFNGVFGLEEGEMIKDWGFRVIQWHETAYTWGVKFEFIGNNNVISKP